jgi:pseudouridine-5'-phosphate glycosidase
MRLETSGRSVGANRALLLSNARLAAELAAALAA